MIILGIETSCDETALSLVETNPKNDATIEIRVLGEALISQVKLHEPYGGVFPVLAKREHGKNLVPLLHKLLKETSLDQNKTLETSTKWTDLQPLLAKESELLPLFEEFFTKTISLDKRPAIDAIAVTEGPGLEPALWVGISFAKALGLLWNIPVIPVNHMEGHVVASLLHPASTPHEFKPLQLPALPAIALLISGGHTELLKMRALGSYELVGSTRDDAIGEAFDKVARLLDLPYPGGPQIATYAEKARQKKAGGAEKDGKVFACQLPRPMIHSADCDLSFSGLKTAVRYLLEKIDKNEEVRAEVSREFEDAVTEVLAHKTEKALEQTGGQSLIVGGGVSANTTIRQALTKLANQRNIEIYLPDKKLSTDNAIMIAIAGALHSQHTKDPAVISAKGNLALSR